MSGATTTVSVDLEDGGIQQDIFPDRFIRAGIDYALENVGCMPVAKQAAYCSPVAKRSGQIKPWVEGAYNPKHRFNNQPFVSSAATGIDRV